MREGRKVEPSERREGWREEMTEGRIVEMGEREREGRRMEVRELKDSGNEGEEKS